MSVRKGRSRLTSSTRDNGDINTYYNSIQTENTNNIEYVLCLTNCLQFHRKLTQSLSLHLICVSKQNSEQSTTELNDNQFTFQIIGNNLNICKAHVRHTFALSNYFTEDTEYFRIEMPTNQFISVENFSYKSKSGIKIYVINDVNKIYSNHTNRIIVKPVDLIEQNARLRVLKLNKSTTKNGNISCSQSTKKLNINWGSDSQKTTQNQNVGWPKRQLIKPPVLHHDANCAIRGVEFKHSVQRKKSMSISKNQQSMRCLRIVKNTQNEANRSRLNSSKSQKKVGILNENSRHINLHKMSVDMGSVVSSESYYTAKKQIKKDNGSQGSSNKKDIDQIEIPSKIESKRVPDTKQNMTSSKKQISKWGYSQYHNLKQGQLSAKVNTTLDPKKFSKNISQAKIAQVSRAFILSKAP